MLDTAFILASATQLARTRKATIGELANVTGASPAECRAALIDAPTKTRLAFGLVIDTDRPTIVIPRRFS